MTLAGASPAGEVISAHAVEDRVSATIPAGDRHFEALDIARSEIE
jgi:hypothetical protein